MRSILFALMFTLAVVPAVQAQQIVAPVVTGPSPTSFVQDSPDRIRPDVARVEVGPVESRAQAESELNAEAAAAAAMREPTARTALAIVGAVFLVVAVIALVR